MKIVKHQAISLFRITGEKCDRAAIRMDIYLCEVLGEKVVAVFTKEGHIWALWPFKEICFIEFKVD